MKRLLSIITIIITLIACSGKFGDNEFLVKGSIENAKGKMLFLSEYTENGPVTVDSIAIEDNGEFKLKGRTSFPKYYMLRISPNEYVTLVIDSANVLTVTADANDFVKSHKVEGSNDMDLLVKLNKQLEFTYRKRDSLGQIYQDNEGSDAFDSIKARIDQEFNMVVEAQREFSRKFVAENAGSMVSIIALSQQLVPNVPVLTLPDDLSYFEKVDSMLFVKYPQSENVKRLHSALVKMKSQPAVEEPVGNYGIGDIVPDIALQNPEGKTISLYSLRGKYVLLDFWAGWCSPCRRENPNLVENYGRYKSKGFDIFQVSLDKEKEMWMKAIEQDGLSAWKHVSDLQFWQSAPVKQFNITSIPANYLINPEGKVIAVNLRGEALGAKLNEVFSR